MKRKFLSLFLVAIISLTPVQVFADEKDDRIAELEIQVAELEAQILDLQQKLEEANGSDAETTNQDLYKIGDTWIVENAFKLTIDSVEAMQERNEYADTDPAAVYLLTYTYENIGLEEELFFSLDFMTSIIDSEGKMGYSYPGDITYFPQGTPKGAICEAQACIGVDNAGSFTLIVSQYDNEYNEHEATFYLEIE